MHRMPPLKRTRRPQRELAESAADFDRELCAFAAAHDIDLAKAYRLLLQRGLAAPIVPAFALSTLRGIAKARGQGLDALLVEILTRYAIEARPDPRTGSDPAAPLSLAARSTK
jgi:hypothetical protein